MSDLFGIPGVPGAYASRDGRLWSRRKPRGVGLYEAAREVRGTVTRDGYRRVRFSAGKRGLSLLAHRVVALVFIGPPPDGMQVNHIDGDKLNNAVENLEYVTCRENIRHSIRMGLFARGERMGSSKLTEEQVLEIRRLYSEGGGVIRAGCAAKHSTRALAKRFGVSASAISGIVTGRTWTHLTANQCPVGAP